MDQRDNPYAAPQTTSFELIPSAEPRSLGPARIVATGAIVGAASFLPSMALIPSDVASFSEHDLRLANHLGFVYPPLVALWGAWVRRSALWAVLGLITGLGIGGLYYLLCGRNFLAVMVFFPCLLGGCASVLLGTTRDSWFSGLRQRFFKGMFAGFILGVVYAVLLNVTGFLLHGGFYPTVSAYRAMMWQAGTLAMTVASGLYFLLFHWSAGLRSVPQEDVEESDRSHA